MVRRFRIRLRGAHQSKGTSVYRVSKDTGIAQNTVRKYIEAPSVIADYIPVTVVRLAEYYGVDWRNPDVIEVVEEGSTPENSAPLLATA